MSPSQAASSWVGTRRQTFLRVCRRAPGGRSPTAEAGVLGASQCGFDSRRPHARHRPAAAPGRRGRPAGAVRRRSGGTSPPTGRRAGSGRARPARRPRCTGAAGRRPGRGRRRTHGAVRRSPPGRRPGRRREGRCRGGPTPGGPAAPGVPGRPSARGRAPTAPGRPPAGCRGRAARSARSTCSSNRAGGVMAATSRVHTSLTPMRTTTRSAGTSATRAACRARTPARDPLALTSCARGTAPRARASRRSRLSTRTSVPVAQETCGQSPPVPHAPKPRV